MPHITPRREFLATVAAAGAGLTLGSFSMSQAAPPSATEPLFKISLAEWSLHKMIFDKQLDNLDFPAFAKETFGIEAVEYVNQFFMDKATDAKYLADLKQRCADHGVQSVLIMCDNEGDLGDPDEAKRIQAVERHYKWVEAAKALGCHSIRVNARSQGTRDEQVSRAVDGLRRLTEFGAQHGMGVIVENHGGLSSDGKWLAEVIGKVGLDNCGTLPDFGNFVINRETGEAYDRYQGVTELMPFAKGVSAKTYAFDANGNEPDIDYPRIMKIVLDSGYHGYVGIEWEGDQPESEVEGIKLTQRLLERVREELASQPA